MRKILLAFCILLLAACGQPRAPADGQRGGTGDQDSTKNPSKPPLSNEEKFAKICREQGELIKEGTVCRVQAGMFQLENPPGARPGKLHLLATTYNTQIISYIKSGKVELLDRAHGKSYGYFPLPDNTKLPPGDYWAYVYSGSLDDAGVTFFACINKKLEYEDCDKPYP